MRVFVLFGLLAGTADLAAQTPVRMQERLPLNAAYHVSCRVQITGKMVLSDRTLPLEGRSEIEYDERVLRIDGDGRTDKTIRHFSKMAFERKIGDDLQKASLRPEVHRLVIVRQGNIEAPFSPDGWLKINEIDLIRTDVFTPALAGLFPKAPVSPGDTWTAEETAVRELTDLGEIASGKLTCRFDKLDRSLAKVSFQGTIAGVGENGPTRHELDGFCYFDVSVGMLTYVSLKGTEHLVDDKNKSQGTVTGNFVLTREPRPAPGSIAEQAAAATLEPNEDNTRILFEDEDAGVRFAHSRKWKPRVEGTQVKLDDLRGNGMVLSIDPLPRAPSMKEFLEEARAGVERRRGVVSFVGPTQSVQRRPTSIESTTLDIGLPADAKSDRGVVYLAIIRDETAAATLAATLLTSDRAALAREVERLAATVRVSRPK